MSGASGAAKPKRGARKGSGNTTPRPKRENPLDKWGFRMNAEGVDVKNFELILVQRCIRYAFQLERGEQATEKNPEGYLHYQGCMTLTIRTRFSAVLQLFPPGTELFPAADMVALWKYCTKEETRVDGPWVGGPEPVRRKPKVVEPEPEVPEGPKRYPRPVPTTWRPKQQQVIDWVSSPPDERSILVWVDPEGGSGKTTVLRELLRNHNAMLVGGSTKDSLFAVGEGNYNCYVVNLARSKKGKIPVEAIEYLKDGVFFNEKYESKMVVVDHMVHVVIFCNEMPDLSTLTMDRWKFVE